MSESAREEAKRLKQKTFIPENPCKYGHYLRYTKSRGNCVICSTARNNKTEKKALDDLIEKRIPDAMISKLLHRAWR